jgi:regulator of RNase E activity RraA
VIVDQNDNNVVRASKLDTAAISDALDRLTIEGQCFGIKPRADSFEMVGRAFTVLYEPATLKDGNVGDYIDDVPPGRVVAIDSRGRDDSSVWGNILTEVAHKQGIAGTVIDGNNRDVALSRKLGYPLFSIDHWMRTGKGRNQVKAIEVPIVLGGVVVKPGDILRGDADGVVVIPQGLEDKILEIAEEISSHEDKIRDAVRNGQRLDEARRSFHYYNLQAPGFDAKTGKLDK